MRKMRYAAIPVTAFVLMPWNVLAQGTSGGATEISYTATASTVIPPDTGAALIGVNAGNLFVISLCFLILLILFKKKRDEEERMIQGEVSVSDK